MVQIPLCDMLALFISQLLTVDLDLAWRIRNPVYTGYHPQNDGKYLVGFLGNVLYIYKYIYQTSLSYDHFNLLKEHDLGDPWSSLFMLLQNVWLLEQNQVPSNKTTESIPQLVLRQPTFKIYNYTFVPDTPSKDYVYRLYYDILAPHFVLPIKIKYISEKACTIRDESGIHCASAPHIWPCWQE